MVLLDIVKQLETPSTGKRFSFIVELLTAYKIAFDIQHYDSGKNIIVYPGDNKLVIGVSSHFDVVPGSPGANDNASAIAVCIAILQKTQTHRFNHFDVAVFFFDEEETGLLGSEAFVNKCGVQNIKGLINLEMVGQGDRLALWPLNEKSRGVILEKFEAEAAKKDIFCRRFDKIVTNSADHVSFREAGVADAFTITCISQEDLIVAQQFYMAQQSGASFNTLQNIIKNAPVFEHYHKPTDLSMYLSEQSLQLTVENIWDTLLALDVE